MSRAMIARLDALEEAQRPETIAVWFPGEPKPEGWAEAQRHGIAVSFPDSEDV